MRGRSSRRSCCGAGSGACGCPDVPGAGEGESRSRLGLRNPVSREALVSSPPALRPAVGVANPKGGRVSLSRETGEGGQDGGRLSFPSARPSGERKREAQSRRGGCSMSAHNGIPDWRSKSARHPLGFYAEGKTWKETKTRVGCDRGNEKVCAHVRDRESGTPNPPLEGGSKPRSGFGEGVLRKSKATPLPKSLTRFRPPLEGEVGVTSSRRALRHFRDVKIRCGSSIRPPKSLLDR